MQAMFSMEVYHVRLPPVTCIERLITMCAISALNLGTECCDHMTIIDACTVLAIVSGNHPLR